MLLIYFGSSPRVRGTVRHILSKIIFRRFIPACAGNSSRQAWIVFFKTVHPRVCGEQKNLPPWVVWGGGSSPRVRGTGSSRARNPRL